MAYSKAISLAKTQLEINPKDSSTWVMVADYYAMLDNKRNAYENLQKGLRSSLHPTRTCPFAPPSFTTTSAIPAGPWTS